MTLPKIRHSPGKMMGLEDDPAAFWVFVFFFRGKLAVKLFLGEGTLEVCVCVCFSVAEALVLPWAKSPGASVPDIETSSSPPGRTH